MVPRYDVAVAALERVNRVDVDEVERAVREPGRGREREIPHDLDPGVGPKTLADLGEDPLEVVVRLEMENHLPAVLGLEPHFNFHAQLLSHLVLDRLDVAGLLDRTSLEVVIRELLIKDTFLGDHLDKGRAEDVDSLRAYLARQIGMDGDWLSFSRLANRIGAAASGMRPLWVHPRNDFMFLAADQIINQVAKMHFMTAGLLKASLVIRTHQRVLLSAGPHHSGKYEGLYGSIPGLMVVYPSTPYDAKGLLKSAIRDDNPIIFIEERTLYEFKGEVPDKEYFVPIGKAEIKREGTDVTIVSYGRCFHEGLRAAEILEADGISSEIVDLRTIQPLDKEAIINSVKKTGRLVIVHDACKTGGLGAEITALVAEEALGWLEAPVRRVAALDTIMTFNPKLEAYIQPNADKIVKAVREVVQWSG